MTKGYKFWAYLYMHIKTELERLTVVSSNPDYGEVYSMQHYVIMFVNDLRQAGGILPVLRFPPPIKLPSMI
jgi:hypothetical protein